MLLLRQMYYRIAVLVVVLSVPGVGANLSPEDAVVLITTRLQQSQVHDGPEQGLWPDEKEFMGPTTAGMACAYDWTGDTSYLSTARFATYYLLHEADLQGNLLGDEAYAIVRMSQVSKFVDTPYLGDRYRSALIEFYDGLRDPDYEGSTQEYMRHFDEVEPSTNVFFFAHHVLAAYYVDDPDKELWRDALISWLSRVDDESIFPVTALGTATWALAEIDALDDTPITSDNSSPYWEGIVLRDLPSLLLGHQVPPRKLFAGSFYWRFDHGGGGSPGMVAGFTEDAVYCTLGLTTGASLKINLQNEEMRQAILLAQEALLQGIDADGAVHEHLCRQGEIRHMFAGEVLQGLWGVKRYLAVQADAETAEAAPLATGEN